MFDRLKDIVSDVIGGNAEFGNLGDLRDNVADPGNLADPGALGDLAQEAGFGEMQQYVEGIEFPASTGEILTQLQENGASADLLARVQETGEQHFAGPTELLTRVFGNR